eukprot:CAMPEP_0113509838 /NCGR_PEP_ID=MMETSP0014_2-20120614/37798_1 /TAXON_ID=2857 /ORGANISM="Nitzschia sp." /LENGTH=624 /DNA_ID=CAMNT_0000405713 /DNA_START=279 /DNA_END=2150 /DNA_ORIENTATION=- /assembly_acc=CAM_ASM_000159
MTSSAATVTDYIVEASTFTDPQTGLFGYVEVYEPISQVNSFSKLPRFSNSDDISLLFSSSEEDHEDYTLGLLFLSTFIVSFFVVWMMYIVVLKCIGPKLVGVFSGYPYVKDGRRPQVICGRLILVLSSLSIIICSIVLVTKGLTELQYTTDTIVATNNEIKLIHEESSILVSNIDEVSSRALPVRNELVEFLRKDVCPLNPGSATENRIRAMADNTLDGLNELDGFVESYLGDVKSALDQIDTTTQQISQATQNLQFTSSKVIAIMIPYFIIPAFVMVGVAMGYWDVFSEGYYSFLTWFVLPCMVILTIFAFVAAGWVAIVVQGNSDFCSPSPESTIQNIMAQYESLKPGTFYYDTVMFYVQQCGAAATATTGSQQTTTTTTAAEVTNPWTFMETYNQALVTSRIAIDEFATTLNDASPAQLSQLCGVEYGRILDLLQSMNVHVDILKDASRRSLDLYKCSTIVPLYTNVVYDATCQYSIVGATWIFACLLCIAFLGMLVITFRGAYYPIDYYYYYAAGHDGDEDKSFYGSTSSSSDGDDDDDDDDDNDENEDQTDDGQPKTDTGATKTTKDGSSKLTVKKLGVLDTKEGFFVPDDMADDDVYTFPSTLPSGSMLDEQYLKQQK